MGERGELEGRRALVTGGGTGIGLGITQCLLRAGATVTIAARREDVLAEAVTQLEGEGHAGRIQYALCDVTNEEQVEQAVSTAAADANLDVLVNNSGSAIPGVLLNMSADAWRFCSDINLVGPAICMRHAALRMKDNGGGSIVNISSVSSQKYQPWLIGYNATKAAQDMLTRSASVELAQHGIRVNSVAPGFVPVPGPMAESPRIVEDYVHITPLRRPGTPRDVGEAVLFFASDKSDWVTGQCLQVDGGLGVPLMLDMGELAGLVYPEEVRREFAVEDYRSTARGGANEE